MQTFVIRVTQYVEQILEFEVQARNARDARAVYDDGGDAYQRPVDRETVVSSVVAAIEPA